jgi:HEAT repeat protein
MTLANRLGGAGAVEVLVRLLGGTVPEGDLAWAPYRGVLLDIGDGHAERLMSDESGRRLDYWPRVWAARALAYVGSREASPVLITALGDGHWRVRMTAIQTIGRLSIEGVTPQLLERLNDEHARVRSAAILALDRVGTEEAVQQLLRQPVTGGERARADRAVARILERADRS